MSSPLLSDSTDTFIVDCNVAGALLESRPKFKFLQNSSDFFFFLSFIFFYQHGNLLSQESARVGFYIIPLCLGQGLYKWLSKDKGQNGRHNPAADTAWVCGLTPF